MGLKTKSILGIDITIDTKEKVLKEVEKWLKKPRTKDQELGTKDKNSLIIFTPNPEIITYSQKDDQFKRIVNSAQINIPDGGGITWAMKKTYGLEIQRISGVDLMLDICRLAWEKGLTVGLIGGRGAVAVDAGECLRKKYLGLKVEVLEAGEMELVASSKYQVAASRIHATNYLLLSTDNSSNRETKKYFENLINKIKQKKIDILFVALGCPKQEYFIDSIRYYVSGIKYKRPLVLMAVGGSLDYISGKIPRSPEWMRKRGLEWLYRLIKEPRRLGRMIKGGEFFWKVLT